MQIRLIAAFLGIIVLLGCKDKQPDLSGKEIVSLADLVSETPEIALPFWVADSSFKQKPNPEQLMEWQLFKKLFSDTVLAGLYGKSVKPNVWLLGKQQVSEKETYFFFRTKQNNKQAYYILVVDEQNQFKASLKLLDNQIREEGFVYSSGMDKRYAIQLNRTKQSKDGIPIGKREVWVYNNAGLFTLILTEGNNQANSEKTLVNPIDTLSAKFSLSGDYMQDKKNIVSFRDGVSEKELLFFIHFEKSNGTCVGELRGVAREVRPNVYVYRDAAGPCVLEFTFGKLFVTMREAEACGAYRGIKCFFEGKYPKKSKSGEKTKH